MTDLHTIESLPAGSTIILSTTSPDKRAEYDQIFKRYDINFVFLEDLGLSPQKTDEMTNTYAGNLQQKAGELSLALHTNMEAIKDRLKKFGYDVNKPVVGMVEDSGIEIYPINTEPAVRASFRKEFKRRIDERIHDSFLVNDALKRDVFPGMSNSEILDYLANAEVNNVWMTKLDEDKILPGPNYKPIYEALPGGVREFFDIMHDAMEAVMRDQEPDSRAVGARSLLRFRNHCSLMLVEPHERPQKHIMMEDIIEGESKGKVATRDEVDSLIKYRIESPKAKHKLGRLFTSDFIIPDNQKNNTDYTQRRLIESKGLLDSDGKEVASYYRLNAIEQLEKRYNIPLATRSKDGEWIYDKRANNPDSPDVLVLHSGKTHTQLSAAFERKLEKEKFSTIKMPEKEELLKNPNARLMANADVVFIMPGEGATDIENAQLIIGATVDKQVMPTAKQKTLIVLNPITKGGKGKFDGALKIIRHKKYTGLKNGISEINHIIEYNPQEYKGDEGAQRLFDEVHQLLKKESERKKHRLTGVEPIQAMKHIAQENIPSVALDNFTVFVAGGAANEYPGFKAPANQLGRYIHDEGWTLVTGAGQKDGPMGAVHSGFVEAFLSKNLHTKANGGVLRPKEVTVMEEIVETLAIQNTTNRNLRGEDGKRHRQAIRSAVFETPNAEFLGHEAPEVLEKLLQPRKKSRAYEIIGSLKASGRMVGYSMPPLLISEGSGKWPLGMQGFNAGNMQRRMHEMLQSAAHVFLAGGQGTDQELIESAKLAIEMNLTRKEQGLPPKPIYLLDQRAYKDGVYDRRSTVFLPALELIDKELESAGFSREDIGLKTYDNMRHLEKDLKEYAAKHWGQKKEAALAASA